MDADYTIYQLHIQLWNIVYPNWLSEFATIKFWGTVLFILVYYAVWWKLTDKRRISDLLLYGSFMAVLQVIIDAFGVTTGLWYYKIHIVPLSISIFLLGLTIIPLSYMVVQQYSPNWKRFFINNAIGTGFVFFVVLPIIAKAGVFQLMKLNILYSYILMFFAASFSRLAFHLVKQVQYKALEGVDSPLQTTLMHPAFKPLANEESDEKKK